MTHKHILVVLAAALACDRGTPATAGADKSAAGIDPRHLADSVKVDLTTPDRAVKTYWRLRDAELQMAGRASRDYFASDRYAAEIALQRRVLGGEALAEAEQRRAAYITPSYASEIVEVKSESESRALVSAKIRNTTPVSPGIPVSERDAERRRDGSLVRYTLEKDATGWHVVQGQSTLLGDGQGEWSNHWKARSDFVPTWVTP